MGGEGMRNVEGKQCSTEMEIYSINKNYERMDFNQSIALISRGEHFLVLLYSTFVILYMILLSIFFTYRLMSISRAHSQQGTSLQSVYFQD